MYQTKYRQQMVTLGRLQNLLLEHQHLSRQLRQSRPLRQ
jgi:hypothetical protein